jgi:dTMP kinase
VTRPGPPARGHFIAIEGPDGAGKTTQASALAGHLRAIADELLGRGEPERAPMRT